MLTGDLPGATAAALGNLGVVLFARRGLARRAISDEHNELAH